MQTPTHSPDNDPKSWGRPIVGSFITLFDWIAI